MQKLIFGIDKPASKNCNKYIVLNFLSVYLPTLRKDVRKLLNKSVKVKSVRHKSLARIIKKKIFNN